MSSEVADTITPERRDAPTSAESPVQRTLGIVAGVAGIAYVWWVIGGVIVLQYNRDWEPPMDWLSSRALWAVPVVVLALASRRLSWPTMAIGGLLTVWLGAGAISSWRLAGVMDGRSLMLGLVCGGLFFGVAATRPIWTGWSIFLLGSGWVLLTVYVYYRAYYSLGQAFPGTTQWLSDASWQADSMASVEEWRGGRFFASLPYPDTRLERLRALIVDAPRIDSLYKGLRPFQYFGLTGNANMTGNFLAPFLAFVVPFAAHRWRAGRAWQWFLIAPVRIAMITAVLVPGLFMLYVMAARAALGAVIFGLILLAIPMKWSRNPVVASVAALLVPLGVIVPFLLTRNQGVSLNGRACVWNELWLPAIRNSPVWGIGPPGRFSDACLPGSPSWIHAHNEFFQAWSLGGILGFSAAVATVAVLAWFAVRYSDRDNRALVALLACCAVLMGFEVLSSFRGYYLHLGIAWFVVIAGYSMRRILPREATPQRDSRSSARTSTALEHDPDRGDGTFPRTTWSHRQGGRVERPARPADGG